MRDEKVYYQQNFSVGQFLFVNIGVGLIVEKGETAEQVLAEAKKRVHDYFKSDNPHLFDAEQQPLQTTQTEKPIRTIEDDILSCTTLEGANGLRGYKMIA